MPRRRVDPDQHLPLSCTRAGTCCHGKEVAIGPWELASLAAARGMDARAFRDRHTDGGIRLRFDGPPGWRGLPACSQYEPGVGCRAHAGRPLACRLYPLGRERRGERIDYVHDGRDFPCLAGCPEVRSLPAWRVRDWLADQGAAPAEAVQDAYLQIALDLAEAALALAIEGGLAADARGRLLAGWTALAAQEPAGRALAMGTARYDLATVPASDPARPQDFLTAHREALRAALQAEVDAARDVAAIEDCARGAAALALHLAQSVGAPPRELAAGWCATVRRHAG